MSKTHVITFAAQDDMEEIYDFIAGDNITRADEFIEAAVSSFEDLRPNTTFKRAHRLLPDYVRELPVKGFEGYTLRATRHQDGRFFMLSAHRPGRSTKNKNFRTQRGLRDVDEM